MYKVTQALLVGCVLFTGQATLGDEWYDDKTGITWTYNVYNGMVSLGGGTSSSIAVSTSTTGTITIPSNLGGYVVTRIGDNAFLSCSGLNSVTIPDSVTSIGYSAFYGCSGLTSIVFEGNAPYVVGDALSDSDSSCTVYVPRGSTGWGVEIPGIWNGMRIEYAEEASPDTWTVTFDANGGELAVADSSRQVEDGTSLGELPVPSRLDYTFLGWFTAADGGEEVSSEVVVTSDITFYAHWQCRFSFDGGPGWTQQMDGSWKSNPTADGETNLLSMTVSGSGTIAFRWKTSCEGYFNFKGMLIRQDGISLIVDGDERTFTNGVMSAWAECSLAVEGDGCHDLVWAYIKDSSGFEGADCAWLDSVVWTPNTSAGIVIKGNGKVVAFEMSEDGKTRTAAVTAGTTGEDVRVFVGGVDVTKGFKVEIEGTTATVVLKAPYEAADATSASIPWTDNGDGSVTLNVEVVPGLYYAADSAAMIESLKCPGAAEPAKTGDVLTLPKQEGAHGFYKVWVSDAPITADD